MAISFDAASSKVQATPTTMTWSHTNNGDLLLVGLSYRTNEPTVTVTYNGVSMTEVTSTIRQGVHNLRFFYLANPATGANNIVVTFSTFINYAAAAGAISLSGTDTTSPIGQIGTNATGTATSSTIALSNIDEANSWIVDTIYVNNNNETPTSPQVQRVNVAYDTNVQQAMSTLDAETDPDSMVWTFNANITIHMAAEIKAAGGGGGLSIPVAQYDYRRRRAA